MGVALQMNVARLQLTFASNDIDFFTFAVSFSGYYGLKKNRVKRYFNDSRLSLSVLNCVDDKFFHLNNCKLLQLTRNNLTIQLSSHHS